LDAAAAIFHKKIFAGKTGLPGIPIIFWKVFVKTKNPALLVQG
jgi:hypothetical protein